MMSLTRLRYLLEHIHSFENCSEIIVETHRLMGEPHGWFFHKLHSTLLSLIDEPDTFYGVNEANPSPVLEEIAIAAQRGLAAIELSDNEELLDAAACLGRAIDA